MRKWDPGHRIVLDVQGAADIVRERLTIPLPEGREVRADLYAPPGPWPAALRPAVLFVHGDADAERLRGVLDWGQYISWGEAVAARGMVGVTFEHSSSEHLRGMRRVIEEVDAMLGFLRADGRSLGIDPDRIGLWTCSGGAPFAVVSALRASPPVRCLVSYYGFLDLRHLAGRVDPAVGAEELAEASPAAVVARIAHLPPTLVVKAGLDRPAINDSIDAYVAAVARRQPPIQLLVHTTGHHAFDVLDDDETSRSIIASTIEFLSSHLGA